MSVEVKLKLKRKYRAHKPVAGGSARTGNSGVSNGKHVARPDVHGFRRNGYRCEAKWNRPEPPPVNPGA